MRLLADHVGVDAGVPEGDARLALLVAGDADDAPRRADGDVLVRDVGDDRVADGDRVDRRERAAGLVGGRLLRRRRVGLARRRLLEGRRAPRDDGVDQKVRRAPGGAEQEPGPGRHEQDAPRVRRHQDRLKIERHTSLRGAADDGRGFRAPTPCRRLTKLWQI